MFNPVTRSVQQPRPEEVSKKRMTCMAFRRHTGVNDWAQCKNVTFRGRFWVSGKQVVTMLRGWVQLVRANSNRDKMIFFFFWYDVPTNVSDVEGPRGRRPKEGGV